jgi:hypothetical protein
MKYSGFVTIIFLAYKKELRLHIALIDVSIKSFLSPLANYLLNIVFCILLIVFYILLITFLQYLI